MQYAYHDKSKYSVILISVLEIVELKYVDEKMKLLYR